MVTNPTQDADSLISPLVGLIVETSTIKPTRGQNTSEGPLLWVESRAEAILRYWFCFVHSESVCDLLPFVCSLLLHEKLLADISDKSIRAAFLFLWLYVEEVLSSKVVICFGTTEHLTFVLNSVTWRGGVLYPTEEKVEAHWIFFRINWYFSVLKKCAALYRSKLKSLNEILVRSLEIQCAIDGRLVCLPEVADNRAQYDLKG